MMMGQKPLIVPLLRISGVENHTGTSWVAPASAAVGDLIIATRLASGGTAFAMGADFTLIGDNSSASYKISTNYRIVTSAGATHTIPSGGIGVIWSVWRAGTFNASAPASGFSTAVDATHSNITWPSATVAATAVVIGGAWSAVNMQPGIIPGATLLSENAASRYSREFFKVGGWAGQVVTNDPAGTVGQRQTRYYFTVAGA
jgi:hypothetical protein